MAKAAGHHWEFRARFRRDAFGWRSQPAIQRVKEAVAEIRKVAKKDPVLGSEGAVLFLERVSAALNHVDSSSGSMGTAVNNAIAALVPVISSASVDTTTREIWLERLWEAHAADQIPYLEILTDYWGELCASKEVASAWADRLLPGLRLAWMTNQKRFCFFPGATACLSALLRAERHAELLAVLKLDTPPFWSYQQWGVRALAAMGKLDEALGVAESMRGRDTNDRSIARVCEEILLSVGRTEDAYRRYGLAASRATTHLATYRAIAKKYPQLTPVQILTDLVAASPGQEGQWFAAAKEAGLLDIALQLASTRSCDPKTLTRAARDYAESDPNFALGVGLAALHWMAEGYGYELTGRDVWAAYLSTMKAAEIAGRAAEVKERIHSIVALRGHSSFVAQVLQGSPK